MILSVFRNTNTRRKRSRAAGNLQLAYEHLTDLQARSSRKRSLERENVVLPLRPIFARRIDSRSLAPRFPR